MTNALQTWTRGRTRVVAAGWAWLVAATWFSSDALLGGLLGFCALPATGLGIGIAWVWTSLLWLGNLWTWRGLLLWLTVPTLPVVAVHGARTAWPMTVRVWLSESALREHTDGRHIDPFQHVTGVKPEPKWIGLFSVESTQADENGTTVFTTAHAFFDSGGTLYVPGEMPAYWARDRVDLKHLYGPWYRWELRE